MNVRKLLTPVIVLTVCGAITAFLVLNRPEAKLREATPPVLYVQTLIAEPRSERFLIRAQGTVGPRVETTLVSEVSGQVVDRAASFVAGGFFRRGDVLLEIDPRNYRAGARTEAGSAGAHGHRAGTGARRTPGQRLAAPAQPVRG